MRTSDKPIYLDFAAATPLDERVLAAMRPYFSDMFYNPSSSYARGREVRQALDRARSTVAGLIGAKPSEIIFTAGATESINMAIWGVCAGHHDARVVTTTIEHAAVQAAVSRHDVTAVEVQPATGLVQPESIAAAITDHTRLVSVGYANGEIGTVQPLKAIAQVIKKIRAERLARGVTTPLYLHTDASQAVGALDLHVDRLGVDLMTLNAGKCYGPKQMGVLYVKSPIVLTPLMLGGGQEAGVRSGTENVPGIIGAAEALRLAELGRSDEAARLRRLRDALQAGLCARLPETVISGHPSRRLPGILHAAWPDVDGERLLFALDERGIMVATGSACAANKGTRSHVLEAIGLEPAVADGSLRFSLGRTTDEADVQRTVEAVYEVVMQERAL